MSDRPVPIDRLQVDVQQLVEDHPPRWRDRNKKIVYDIACPPGSSHHGRLEYTRWRAMPWPGSIDARSAVSRLVERPGY